MQYWLILWVLLLITLPHTYSYAESTVPLPVSVEASYSAEALAMINAKLSIAERNLLVWQRNRDNISLTNLSNQTIEYAKTAQNCITEFEKQKVQAEESLKSLGVQESAEDMALRQKRNELDNQIKGLTRRVAQCRLMNLRAETIQKTIRTIEQEDLRQFISVKEASLLDNIQILAHNPILIQAELQHIINALKSVPLSWENLYEAFIYGALGGLVGIFWFYYYRHYQKNKTERIVSSIVWFATWHSIIRIMPVTLFGLIIFLYFLEYTPEQTILTTAMLYLLLMSLSYAIIRAPLQKNIQLDGFVILSDKERLRFQFNIQSLTLIGFLSLLLNDEQAFSSLSSPLLSIFQVVTITLWCLALIRFLWHLSQYFLLVQYSRLHWIASLTLIITMIALWAGYLNFAEFLFICVFSTLFTLMLSWFFQRIMSEVCDGLDVGKTAWQKRLRKLIDLKESQLFPGLIWVRLVIFITFNTLTLLILLKWWSIPEQTIVFVVNKLWNGIPIGQITLEPARIVMGIFIAGLLISFSQFFKKYLADSWLKRTNMTQGAQDAMTTIAGYIGIILAVVIGLSIAGLKFQNLAIIAGALSVGIGFGLQNVVNNFVSGLILLFERPIRRGDWIQVGTAEGYVKSISIRSTTIQNFDRADIIVPNSELISGRVTNMFLNDSYGRVIIPLRVAYGTDITKLMTLLVSLTKDNHEIIHNQPDMRPRAFFRSFGDSALNFELRFFIHNVEERNAITSDLLVLIEKAFREQGIVIPYPQYIVHTPTDLAHSPHTEITIPIDVTKPTLNP